MLFEGWKDLVEEMRIMSSTRDIVRWLEVGRAAQQLEPKAMKVGPARAAGRVVAGMVVAALRRVQRRKLVVMA